MLKLMYITNRTDVAIAAENAGVDRIFVDFEYIGKDERQHGMNTVKNHHVPADVRAIRNVITRSELLVRVNPIHDASDLYSSSEEEINAAIENGADIIMLPFFKSAEEIRRCISIIDGRAKFIPLLETPEAVDAVDEILSVDEIDEIHIGINDLSIGYHRTFMFELLIDGTVENLCNKFREKGIPYGFGGIASLGHGLVPAEYIIARHYQLGSSLAILSRSFCNIQDYTDLSEISMIFQNGIKDIRSFERECQMHIDTKDEQYFSNNLNHLQLAVAHVLQQGAVNK